MIIVEFVGNRAKMYSLLLQNGTSKSAVKGVSRVVTEQELKHSMFKDCLMNYTEMSPQMVKIGHKNHQLETQTTMKKSLSPFNDKKWIHKCGEDFKTYSFGNKNIEGELYLNFYKCLYCLFLFSWKECDILVDILADLYQEGNNWNSTIDMKEEECE